MFGSIKKRMWLLTGGLIIAALMLAACGNNADNLSNSANSEQTEAQNQSEPANTADAASNAAAEETDTAANEDEPAFRQITDAVGRKVQVPNDPQRIVAHYYASEITALGLPMVGTNFINAKQVLTDEQLQGIEDVGGEELAPNLEKLVSLSPDLILVPDFLETAQIDALAKIAPTVVISYSGDAFTRIRTLGEIVGKTEQAESWITSYQAKAEEKRNQLKSVISEGETASAFVIYMDKQLYIYGPQRLGPTMYEALGFTMPAKVEELFNDGKNELWKTISMETLTDYAGDRIFLVSPDDSEDAKQLIDEVINGPIWKNIPAVKNGKAYVVNKRWGLNDPLTLDWLLDEMTNVLLK